MVVIVVVVSEVVSGQMLAAVLDVKIGRDAVVVVSNVVYVVLIVVVVVVVVVVVEVNRE